MNFKFVLFSILCINILVFSQANSKKDSLKAYKLDEIVITATKTYTPLQQIGSAISVIDSVQIQQENKINVFDMLKNEYSLSTTQMGGPGKMSNVYLRGDNPGHSIVLLDGIKLNMCNDPNSVYDFANLSLDNISRIEILRGPQSTLYGSDALSGVINIISKESSHKPNLNILTEGGSFNTYKGMIGSSGNFDIFNYAVNLSRYKTSGFTSAGESYGNTEKDGADNYNASAHLGINLYDNLKAKVSYYFTKANADLDQNGGKGGDDPTYKAKTEESFFRAEESLSLMDNFITTNIGFSYTRNLRHYTTESTPLYSYDSRSFYDGRKIKFDWQNNINLNKMFNFVFGLEFEQEQATSEYYSTFYNSVFPNNKNSTSSAYLQSQMNLGDNFFPVVGVRYDRNEKFGSVFTYRIAPAYIINSLALKLRGSAGNGFQAPSLFYLFDPVYGNKNLNPERSFGWDLGFEKYFLGKTLTVGANYFSSKYKDLFGTDSSFRSINTGKAIIKGVEVFASAGVLSNLIVKANYTYLDTKDQTDYKNATNNLLKKEQSLLRRPYNKAGLYISYNFMENANINLETIYTGKRDDIDFTYFTYPYKRVKLVDYTLVNLAGSYRFLNNFEVYFRLENLLNKKYEEIFGYETPKRSGYAGVKISL
ncbi:MAG: TonB-dependent receptor [Bacteroidota bacterium]|nr:TonB-dependent receptor [Bacteroidota bacterium]